MARGTQLLRLVEMVREECGRASSVTVGVDDLPGLKTKIRRNQEIFYGEYDWPHLRTMFPLEQMQAGERYYDPTDGVDTDRIEDIVVWYGGLSHKLLRGIAFSDYNSYNSQLPGRRNEPALKWDVRFTDTREQIEFWPTPSSDNQQWQVIGIRQLPPLVADSDVCVLDDQAIVLRTAAELLASKDSHAAATMGRAAEKRVDQVIGKMAAKQKRYGMGTGPTEIQKPLIVVRV